MNDTEKKLTGLGIYLDDRSYGAIQNAREQLQHVQGGLKKAIGSAIKRAAQSGEAYAARGVRNEYYINASDFKSYTRSKRRIYTSAGSTTIDIEFRGFHIPLVKFDTKVGKDGRVVTRVKRNSIKDILNHAFFASVGGRYGIFERETFSRTPTVELLGPSAPQMLSTNEELQNRIKNQTIEVFNKRFEHEKIAILNGWRQ